LSHRVTFSLSSSRSLPFVAEKTLTPVNMQCLSHAREPVKGFKPDDGFGSRAPKKPTPRAAVRVPDGVSMLIDLHAHSYLSRDCPLDPKRRARSGESFGLDGVAFTETNTQDGCDELFDLQRTTKLKVFVGLELATDKGQYLCFFEKPDRAPEPVQLWGQNREKAWSADECLPRS
jgi:hypothetical protein